MIICNIWCIVKVKLLCVFLTQTQSKVVKVFFSISQLILYISFNLVVSSEKTAVGLLISFTQTQKARGLPQSNLYSAQTLMWDYRASAMWQKVTTTGASPSPAAHTDPACFSAKYEWNGTTWLSDTRMSRFKIPLFNVKSEQIDSYTHQTKVLSWSKGKQFILQNLLDYLTFFNLFLENKWNFTST